MRRKEEKKCGCLCSLASINELCTKYMFFIILSNSYFLFSRKLVLILTIFTTTNQENLTGCHRAMRILFFYVHGSSGSSDESSDTTVSEGMRQGSNFCNLGQQRVEIEEKQFHSPILCNTTSLTNE